MSRGPQRRTRKFLAQLGFLALLSALAWAQAYGYFSWRSFRNHRFLTNEVIHSDLSANEYPDIRKFAGEYTRTITDFLIGGSSNEDAHFDLWDPATQYWFGNEALWLERIFTEDYPLFQFQEAYTHIGFLAHLDQDSTVPAHDKVVFHGPGGGLPGFLDYFYDPEAGELLPREHSVFRLDDYEFYARFNEREQRTDPPWDRRYEHRGDRCAWKYWLDSLEERRGQDDPDTWASNWGGYGRGCRAGCQDPWHDGRDETGRACAGNDGDWYGRVRPDNPEIARGQLFLARQKTRQRLEAVSRALPPLARDFQLSADCFTPEQETVTVRFTALENRARAVRISLLAVELDGDDLPIPGTSRPIQTSEGVWNEANRVLDDRRNSDATHLPWEKKFSLSWNGRVVGAPLRAGVQYGLWLIINDSDNNRSPDLPDPDRDGLWFSLQKFTVRGGA